MALLLRALRKGGVPVSAFVYFRDPEGALQHKSFVVVSDEMSRSSNTVHAIIENIMAELKMLSPDLEFIHYWTDVPTSQYRNKQIVYIIANHKDLYAVSYIL